ncbi:MAG: NADH-quinone oxidoreductase subunit NuoB [Candidatus Methanoplasma sp.]|jgi:Ni,Fe-hydrogenase III small subunit/ferredoxin|nr:NADH-quinone oxidoreductase subunit NuoB [Candidatus Methanoplasma sp.]
MEDGLLKISVKNLLSMKRPAESIPVLYSRRMQMPFPDDTCVKCGECAKECRMGAIAVSDKWTVDVGMCLFCHRCAEACINRSLRLVDAPDYVLRREDLIFRYGEPVERPCGAVDEKKRKAIGRSVNIREVDTGSCNACEVEVNSMSNRFYDMERFGMKVVASPRHADVLLVTGPLTENMTEALDRVVAATPNPKVVVAMGACAISGGLFKDGKTHGGIDKTVDVNLYIPGCPPPPDAVIRALLEAFGLTGRR